VVTLADVRGWKLVGLEADRRQRDTTELSEQLTGVLRRAEQLDTTLAAALEQAATGHIDDGSGDTLAGAAEHVLGVRAPTPPPPGTPPDQVSAWWNTLSGAQQEELLLDNPAGIGNLDGIPSGIRDEANRAQLDGEATRINAEITDTRTRLDAVIARDAQHPVPFGKYSPERVDLEHHLAALQDQRNALDAVDKAIVGDNRELLLLDLNTTTSGHTEPHAAVAVGDITTATHVAVFTPGLFTTVAGTLPDHTTDVAGIQSRAEQLLDATGHHDQTVATVAWLGYDAPQGDNLANPAHTVAAPFAAQTGGTDLARFYDGVATSRPDDPHITALGHSYGSTTTGYALQHTTVVDDGVLFGSPGAATSDVTQLHLPPGHLGVIEARDDPVADLGAFGTDTNHLPGTTQLSAGPATAPDGTPLTESTGHSEYTVPGSTSQYNIAATVAGLPDLRITTTDNSGFGDDLRGGLERAAEAN
jgi:alpha/beta hydrolase family protein